jgi:hypothetical protein
MLNTIKEIGLAEDTSALDDIWHLLGGSSPLPANPEEAESLVFILSRDLFGGGDIYAAERKSLSSLAASKQIGLNPEEFSTTEDLEDAIIKRLGELVQKQMAEMSDEELRSFVEGMVQRLPNDDRLKLIEQVLSGYHEMPPAAQAEFRKKLAEQIGMDEADLTTALAGGAAALIPLLLAQEAGFGLFLATTNVMFSASQMVGVTLPFGAYVLKNQALGWLLGPVGMIVTGAATAGIVGRSLWRQKQQMKRLVPLIAYCAAWRQSARTAG